jgi:hypothetical protein
MLTGLEGKGAGKANLGVRLRRPVRRRFASPDRA